MLRPPVSRPRPQALGRWLLVVAALVLAIVAVGGVTRLTESGLSIVEWKPITGTLPPLTEEAWRAEFAGYKTIPQYTAFNRGMTLAEFKRIYFWEYVHRLLARTIGLVLALVLAVFWWRRWIPPGYGRRVLAILALGGLQGAIGWWMVASGLQERTEVSHFRLATHLLAALLIYTVLIWTALDLFAHARRERPPAGPSRLACAAAAALVGQLALGAFTAGLRAGYAFSSWPLMGETLFPEGGWQRAAGLAHNLFSNPVVVQFMHRWWAWPVTLLVVALALRPGRSSAARGLLVAAVACQITLGVGTLLSGVALPIAVLHQTVAAVLLGLLAWTAHGEARAR